MGRNFRQVAAADCAKTQIIIQAAINIRKAFDLCWVICVNQLF